LILFVPTVIWQLPHDHGKNRSAGKPDAATVFRRSCCIEQAVLVLERHGPGDGFYALSKYVVLEAVSSLILLQILAPQGR
jgi:hypothetical protein